MANEAELSWTTSHTAAQATLDFVGRESIRQSIQSVLLSSTKNAQVIFLAGHGGVGKTKLLEEALRIANKVGRSQVASQIIDFYHIQTHTSTGLAQALYNVLTPPEEHFKEYRVAYKRLERLQLSGEAGVERQIREVTDVFIKELKVLCNTTRVVIALDTCERLVYGTSDVDEEATMNAESWEWLIAQIDELENIVIILAGRPEESEPLFKKISVSTIEVGAFSLEESLSYFDEVERNTRARGFSEVAERIIGLTQEQRELAHKCANGRPILLALLVDYLSVNNSIDLSFENVYHFESTIVNRIMGDGSRFGDILRIVGHIRKGLTEELLAYVLAEQHNKLAQNNKRNSTDYLRDAGNYIEKIKDFSFVKIRLPDHRLFLHDEVYALLDRHVYDTPQDEQERETVYQAINKYYESQFEVNRNKLSELFKPIEDGRETKINEASFTEAIFKRQNLLTEDVYYHLRDNASRGYRRYYRYARDAILTNDILLDIQLQLEMLAFFSERVVPARKHGETFIDDLDLSFIDWGIALHPVTRAFAAHDYDGACTKADQVYEKLRELAEKDVFKASSLISWKAYALILKGDDESRKIAADLLNQILHEMEEAYDSLQETKQESHLWRAQAVMAFAYRIRGYLHRIHNEIDKSISDYQRAAQLAKNIYLKFELATIHNDLGFALSEKGKFTDARALVQRGLAIRRELVVRGSIAYSLNTLAMIDMRQGSYENAIREAQSALALFRALNSDRGCGMALTALSETRRRLANSLEDVKEKAALFRQSRDHAVDALEYFKDKVIEKVRRVEAYIELGSTLRDWVAFLKKYPDSQENTERYTSQAKEAFEKAIELADQGLLYRKIDALVNMAWLSYYAEEGEEAFLQACQRAEDEIPATYKTLKKDKDHSLPEGELIWIQLGKISMLRGNMAFDKSVDKVSNRKVINNSSAIKEIAAYYFGGLEYNAHYSPDHQGIRSAKDNLIYPRLAELDAPDLRLLCSEVVALEEQEDLVGQSEFGRMLKARVLWQE